MFKTVFHYAHALESRFFQLYELSLMSREGVSLGRNFAWRIIKNPSETEDWVNFARFLKPHEEVLLLDVGANAGHFTADFLSIYPKGRAVCFEPVQSTFDQLQKNLAGLRRFSGHRCAISDFEGTAKINLHPSTTMSSLCEYSNEANQLYGSGDQHSEEIPCRTLDSFDFKKSTERLLVKIDVQGFEIEVLRGATNTLKLADAVLLECSFVEEYMQRGPSFAPCCGILADCGLFPIIFQDFGRAISNYAFERDVLFVKRELLGNIWLRNYSRGKAQGSLAFG